MFQIRTAPSSTAVAASRPSGEWAIGFATLGKVIAKRRGNCQAQAPTRKQNDQRHGREPG
jgi:hypothetical protein